jgi:LCP family protein required for cell wall assembly
MDDSTQPNMPSEWTEPLDDLTRAIPPQMDFRDELPNTRRAAPNMPPPAPQMPNPAQNPPSYAPLPVYVPPSMPPTANNSQWMLMVAISAVGITLMFGLLAFIGLRVLNARGVAINGALLSNTGTPADVTDVTIASAATPEVLPTFPVAAPEVTPTSIGVQIQPWNGTERFTVLLLGLDKRPIETGTAFRTDAMMLVSFDPKTKSVGILSIPRDLYVEVPADSVTGRYYGLQKVNSAYVLGELARPGYGPQLAMQTVQYNLGIRVHDYVVFEFQTVIDVVNAIGGIDIDVASPISDAQYPDMYYGYVQGVMWNGASVLVPNRAAIGPLLVQVFGPNYNE